MNAVLTRYWKEHAQTQASSTNIWGYMRSFKEAWGLGIYMSEINNAKYSELVTHLKKRGCKPGTINRHMQCFRKVYNLSKNVWGYGVADISFALHRLKEPDCRVRYLTTLEAVSLIQNSAEHLKPIIKFALYTGVRVSNILGLEWNQVDMAGRRIVFKVKSHLPGGKVHITDMVDELYNLLAELKGEHPQYVFTYKGQRIRSVKRAFATACKLAGISNFRFHDLRHTCASWLVQDGAQIAVVRDILGHSSSKMTEKYAHHINEQKLAALNNTFKIRGGIGHVGGKL